MIKTAECVVPYYEEFWKDLSDYLASNQKQVAGMTKRSAGKRRTVIKTARDRWLSIIQDSRQIKVAAFRES
jgi:hypothetical protein